MAVTQTRAASYIQEQTEEISSHQIISLLMDGAIERIDQARDAHINNQTGDLEILLQKFIAIVNGLRNSLNFDAGGDIALNLDALYDYMVVSLTQASGTDIPRVLDEVKNLMSEIKCGWDEMSLGALELSA